MVTKPADEILPLFLGRGKIVGLDEAFTFLSVEDDGRRARPRGLGSSTDGIGEDRSCSSCREETWEADVLSILSKSEDAALRTRKIRGATEVTPILH